MFEDIRAQLKAVGADPDQHVDRPGVSKLNPALFKSLGGAAGVFSEYFSFVQNYGDPGPHPGPYWQDVFRQYTIPD